MAISVYFPCSYSLIQNIFSCENLQTKTFSSSPFSEFIFLGSKITANSDCSHKIKRHLLLGKEAMTNLDSILKSKDISLSTKVCLVKAMVCPMVMYGCESWTVKKAEHQN